MDTQKKEIRLSIQSDQHDSRRLSLTSTMSSQGSRRQSLTLVKEKIIEVYDKPEVKVPFKFIVLVTFFVTSVFFYRFYENWNVLDCFYFMIVCICTVGYGTPSPSNDMSRLYTIFLMFFGIFVIFSGLTKFLNGNLTKMNTYLNKKYIQKLINAQNVFQLRLVVILVTLIIGLFLGAIYFHLNEGWSFITSIYFAVETSTSVGFGDLLIKRDSTKYFLCFYIVFSVILVANAIDSFFHMIKGQRLLQKHEERLKQALSLGFLSQLNHGQGLTKHEFVLTILEHLGTLNQYRDIDPWIQKFEQLDVEKIGILNKEQLEAFSIIQCEESKQDIEHMKTSEDVLLHSLLPTKSFKDLSRLFTTDPLKDDEIEDGESDSFKLNNLTQKIPFMTFNPKTFSFRQSKPPLSIDVLDDLENNEEKDQEIEINPSLDDVTFFPRIISPKSFDFSPKRDSNNQFFPPPMPSSLQPTRDKQRRRRKSVMFQDNLERNKESYEEELNNEYYDEENQCS